MPRVKIKNDNYGRIGTHFYIDGKELDHVMGVDFTVDTETTPEFTFYVKGIPDIDIIGDMHIDFTPHAVTESCRVILKELKKKDGFYKGFLASIKSAIDENRNNNISSLELSRKILGRVIGEE